ncbi:MULTISPECIES: hypothetical protein [Metallosphaera]|uniref:hypothetical protein n=1 Tax=Metallosphaera TaxID=41980 RepID=UPI000AAE4E51|nr:MULTISPECIES: hypothetical protein [Metallosphaera]MCY0862894.1 hypothetical protein [Metallosphaera prunae]WPX06689.1 hypothetical protein SOJ17_000401 [Metallosphaera sedula DSM 5348]BBL46477.1 hypothetical protein MJ1HA_0576 [Metallosphaera sedula]
MALLETQLNLYQVNYFLMSVVFPIWYYIILWKADKDPQVDLDQIAKQESS